MPRTSLRTDEGRALGGAFTATSDAQLNEELGDAASGADPRGTPEGRRKAGHIERR